MATLLVWILSQLSNHSLSPMPKAILFNTGHVEVTRFSTFPVSHSLLLVVGLSVTRPFKLPEWVVALLGMLAPAIFYGAWIFLTGQWESFKLLSSICPQEDSIKQAGVYISICDHPAGRRHRLGFHTTIDQPALVQSRKCWSLVYLTSW